MFPAAAYSTALLTCSNIFSIGRLWLYALFIAMSLRARSVGDFLHNKGKGGLSWSKISGC